MVPALVHITAGADYMGAPRRTVVQALRTSRTLNGLVRVVPSEQAEWAGVVVVLLVALWKDDIIAAARWLGMGVAWCFIEVQGSLQWLKKFCRRS